MLDRNASDRPSFLLARTMTGQRLGPWTLDEEIGSGGMGSVWRAHANPPPEGCPSQAAVKVLAPEIAIDPEFRARFQREAEVLARLNHPGIVRYYGSGIEEGRYFFAMEYVNGPSLQTLLDRRGQILWPEVLALALQLTPALKHAHDHGVIHRDLKPGNILLTKDPSIQANEADLDDPARATTIPQPVAYLTKIADFGVAALFAARHLTVAGGVVGTAEFLSPEQAAGKPVTRRSDLYSLGIVLFTLLTGKPPFQGEVLDLLHKHRYAQPERPARFVPNLPHDLDVLILQLLEKDPARRPPDAGVLQRKIESIVRKSIRQAQGEPEDTIANAPGHATMVSRVVRAELEQQNRGGVVQRRFNRPLVIVPLFLLSLALLVWLLWPASPERQFERGAHLMQSSDPDDWETAWNDHLEPLQRRHPDFHSDEMAAFKARANDARATRQNKQAADKTNPPGEAQWFYQEGLRLRQLGKEEEAQKKWQALADAFRDVPTEGPWVRKAEERLAEADAHAAAKRDLTPVQKAREHADQLRKEGNEAEAQRILSGLKELYREDLP
jgi:serine/threonine protein kinase